MNNTEIRDKFAGIALGAILNNIDMMRRFEECGKEYGVPPLHAYALSAYLAADAMMEVRKDG